MAREVIVKVFILRNGEQCYFVVYRGDTLANEKCIDDTRIKPGWIRDELSQKSITLIYRQFRYHSARDPCYPLASKYTCQTAVTAASS